mgnify:CR=1 FL=1
MDVKIILKKIQSFRENELSESIIIPLFKLNGYNRVQFYGGTDENGKDIVCWGKDEEGDTTLTVVQVKRFKLSKKANGKSSIQTLVNQLSNCFKDTLLYEDNVPYIPTRAILISTYEVDSKTLSSIFSKEQALQQKNIKIIDGLKLASLISKHPSIYNKLQSFKDAVNSKLSPKEGNKILLRALSSDIRKDIRELYIAPDYTLGDRYLKLFNLNLCVASIQELKINYSNLIQLKESISDFKQSINLDTLARIIQNTLNTEKGFEAKMLQERIVKLQKEIFEKTNSKTISLEKLYNTYSLKVLKENLSNYLNELSSYSFKIKIDGFEILKIITKSYDKAYKTFLGFKIQSDRKIFSNLYELTNASETIFTNHILGSVFTWKNDIILSVENKYRIQGNIFPLLDNGFNITILGEAGAGKSTTLQNFHLSKIRHSKRYYFWAPLPKVVKCWQNECSEKSLKKSTLIEGLYYYLIQQSISITKSEFENILKKQRTIFILDAIDEVIKVVPNLIGKLKSFAETYPEVQIITSSRDDCDLNIKTLFPTIRLLPFTDKQQLQFIQNWFGPSKKEKIEEVKNHLQNQSNVQEITRSPLLLTILCVLTDYKITLPDTEIKIYEDRIYLLLGYYDNIKGIERRLSFRPQTFERVIQKIALHLHKSNLRDTTLEELVSIANRTLENKLDGEPGKIIVNELIAPCNLLIPMSVNNTFGFGHLRFQEYLVAKEIKGERSVNLIEIIDNSWWEGTLLLFADMNESIDWLIDLISKSGKFSNVSELLVKMSNKRKDKVNLLKKISDIQDSDYLG